MQCSHVATAPHVPDNRMIPDFGLETIRNRCSVTAAAAAAAVADTGTVRSSHARLGNCVRLCTRTQRAELWKQVGSECLDVLET